MAAAHTSGSLRLWVFNPFVFVAGVRALLIGLAVILAAAILGWATGTHFDGVLDIHTGPSAPLGMFIAEGLLDWLSLSVTLVAAGLIVRRSAFRAVDVFGTQALARCPYIIVPAMLAITPIRNALITVGNDAVKAAGSGGLPSVSASNLALLLVAALVMVSCTVWAVTLMYRAYAVSCDTRGAKGIASFVVAVIAAEVISKLALHAVFLHWAPSMLARRP